MKFLLLLATIAISSTSFAGEFREIKLTQADSSNFKKVLIGFSNPVTIPDVNSPEKWFVVRTFESMNHAFTMSCATNFMSGQEGQTDCALKFDSSQSTPELEVVQGVVGGALAATFNNQQQTSLINRNLGYSPYIANEKVRVKLPSGTSQEYARVRIDCVQISNSGGQAKSCRLVAIPDQPLN